MDWTNVLMAVSLVIGVISAILNRFEISFLVPLIAMSLAGHFSMGLVFVKPILMAAIISCATVSFANRSEVFVKYASFILSKATKNIFVFSVVETIMEVTIAMIMPALNARFMLLATLLYNAMSNGGKKTLSKFNVLILLNAFVINRVSIDSTMFGSAGSVMFVTMCRAIGAEPAPQGWLLHHTAVFIINSILAMGFIWCIQKICNVPTPVHRNGDGGYNTLKKVQFKAPDYVFLLSIPLLYIGMLATVKLHLGFLFVSLFFITLFVANAVASREHIKSCWLKIKDNYLISAYNIPLCKSLQVIGVTRLLTYLSILPQSLIEHSTPIMLMCSVLGYLAGSVTVAIIFSFMLTVSPAVELQQLQTASELSTYAISGCSKLYVCCFHLPVFQWMVSKDTHSVVSGWKTAVSLFCFAVITCVVGLAWNKIIYTCYC